MVQGLQATERHSSSYASEVVESVAGSVAVAVLNAASGVLLARLLGPELRGELAAILVLPFVLVQLGNFGLHDAGIYYGARQPERAGSFVTNSMCLVTLLSLPLVIAAAALTPWLLGGYDAAIVRAGQLCLLLVVAKALAAIPIGLARARHEIRRWNRLRLLGPLLWTGTVAVCFLGGWPQPVLLGLLQVGGLLLLGVLLTARAREALRGSWMPRTELWPRLLRYGIPLSLAAVPQVMHERLNPLWMAALVPPRVLGLYVVALAWAELARLPTLAMSAVVFTRLAGMDEARRWAFLRVALGGAVLAAVATTAALALATAPAILAFFGPDFREAVPVAYVLLVASSLRGLADVVSALFRGTGRPRAVMSSQWLGAAALIPALLLLFPRYGIAGAAAALAVSAGTELVVALLLLTEGRPRRAPLGGRP